MVAMKPRILALQTTPPSLLPLSGASSPADNTLAAALPCHQTGGKLTVGLVDTIVKWARQH